MAVDFDDVKETIRTVALRLDSPSSKYNFVFSESDDAVEVCIEDSNSIDPLFVFVVDNERFRVLKALDLDPDGYVSFPYHSYVELLSFIVEHFYPVFFKLTNSGLITDMLSRILGKRVRVWKDLLRVICESGQVEFVDRGKVFKVLNINFWYNSENHILSVSGELNDSYKCPTVMELVITLLTVLAYVFQLNDLDVNPILGVQEVDEGDNSLFDDEMDMGEDIDSMDMGGGDLGGDMGAGEDLSAEFAPAGDSIDNPAPDMSEGKEEIMDDVLAASYSPSQGKRAIFSMAFGSEETVPDYVVKRFSAFAWDGWIGENKNVQDGSAFARFLDGEDASGVNFRFFFCFGREKNQSVSESSQGDVFKFRALFVQHGGDYYGAKFTDAEFDRVQNSVFKHQLGAVKVLGLGRVSTADPLVFARSSLKSGLMGEVLEADYRVPKGFKSIFSEFDPETATQIDEASTVAGYTPLHSNGRSRIMSARARITSVVNLILQKLQRRFPSAVWRKSVSDLPEAFLKGTKVCAISVYCSVVNKETRKSFNIRATMSSSHGFQMRRE